jgi:hypothetical protein
MPSVLGWVRVRWAGGIALAGFVLFWCYLLQSRANGVDSDAAAFALQASDMLHGNVLLHGWTGADVSFYTTEVPEYAVVEAIRGLRPDDVHVCAALTYTLLVLLTALVARGSARGREGIVRALLAGGIMVAPQAGLGTNTLLESPDHTGTGVPVMLILLLLDRLRPRWYLPVVVLVLLAWVQMADPLATVAAAVPVAAVSLVRAGVRLVRRTWSAEPAWYELSLAAAALVSIPVAHRALTAITVHGGILGQPLPGSTFAPLSALPHQLRVMGLCLLILFGADPVGQAGVSLAIVLLHLVGLILGGLGLVAGIWLFLGRTDRAGRSDRVTQMLVAATLATLAAGWLGTHVTSGFSAHEIAVVLPLAAALAGRTLGSVGHGWVADAEVASVLGLVLAGYLAGLGLAASAPAAPAANAGLSHWLLAHHLHQGLSGYWQADSVVLDSGGQVILAPIYGGAPYFWETKDAWYEPADSYANFVVSVTSPASAAVFTRPAVMLRVFGTPAQTFRFQQYVIMVWHKNILDDLEVTPQTSLRATAQSGSVPGKLNVATSAGSWNSTTREMPVTVAASTTTPLARSTPPASR